jgi:hypothetical protein
MLYAIQRVQEGCAVMLIVLEANHEAPEGRIETMKIVHCPKGGRVPYGYCRASCLNYPGETELNKHIFEQKPNNDVSPLPFLSVKYLEQVQEVGRCVHFGN